MPDVGLTHRLRSLPLEVLYGPAPDERFRARVVPGETGTTLVRELVASAGPLMVSRLGTTELGCLSFYTRWRRGPVRLPYPAALRRIARANAGIFPTDDVTLDRFSETYLAALPEADVLGVWFNRNEHRIVDGYCPKARLVELESLNPVLHEHPWNEALTGRRVLVVHPFATTIESQYRQRRTLLFANPNVLPEFELRTVRAVQSSAGQPCEYASWFDALDAMRQQIDSADFDVAIIGAGAYGLPLAAFVKRMGRSAVHLGGQTQLLFGIRGRRWETESPEDIAPLFNEHWVRPSAEETPEGSSAVEGGCYW